MCGCRTHEYNTQENELGGKVRLSEKNVIFLSHFKGLCASEYRIMSCIESGGCLYHIQVLIYLSKH